MPVAQQEFPLNLGKRPIQGVDDCNQEVNSSEIQSVRQDIQPTNYDEAQVKEFMENTMNICTHEEASSFNYDTLFVDKNFSRQAPAQNEEYALQQGTCFVAQSGMSQINDGPFQGLESTNSERCFPASLVTQSYQNSRFGQGLYYERDWLSSTYLQASSLEDKKISDLNTGMKSTSSSGIVLSKSIFETAPLIRDSHVNSDGQIWNTDSSTLHSTQFLPVYFQQEKSYNVDRDVFDKDLRHKKDANSQQENSFNKQNDLSDTDAFFQGN